MPIKMVVRNDRTAPIVFCDYCEKPITDAHDGNYEWRGHTGSDEPEPVFFTHKRCSQAFETANPDLGGKGGWMWAAMELLVFPLYLANNLEIDPDEAKEHAVQMSQF